MRDRETAWIPFGGAAITATAATLVATNRENYAQIHERAGEDRIHHQPLGTLQLMEALGRGGAGCEGSAVRLVLDDKT